jgi:hypothetical protein
VFTTRLAVEKDYSGGFKSESTLDMSDNSDIDEDDIDTLIGRKKSPNDGEAVRSTLAHAPFFPLVISFSDFLILGK